MNIICIEPDVVLAKVYQQAFTQGGEHSCKMCLDPQAAIEQIDTQKPDIIVMELQLAPLSGFAFLQELRSYEDLTDIPVVIYSSVPQESFAASSDVWRTWGVRRYFYKPATSINKVAAFVHSGGYAS